LRRAIIAACGVLSRTGLSPGKSGNISARIDGGVVITPTGVPYDKIKASDLVVVRADGSVPERQLIASSEWPFHLAIYAARPDAKAIVHTHSPHATSLACLGRGIPAFHYMVAVAGGDRIECAPYATFGTEDLARNAVAALGAERRACLLSNHGQIAIGETVDAALTLAEEVETLAAQYLRARQIGEPHILPADEMARVLEKFKTYGQKLRTRK
jgi:L-fuculose-phosphate aldolase